MEFTGTHPQWAAALRSQLTTSAILASDDERWSTIVLLVEEPNSGLRRLSRMHVSFDLVSRGTRGDVEVVAALQIDPELRRRCEIAREP